MEWNCNPKINLQDLFNRIDNPTKTSRYKPLEVLLDTGLLSISQEQSLSLGPGTGIIGTGAGVGIGIGIWVLGRSTRNPNIPLLLRPQALNVEN